jgi:UDP-N-acetylmuramoylalanine--D-glutamate ligase
VTGRRVAVLGFGITGQAVARSLTAAGDDVVVFDDAGGGSGTAVGAIAAELGVPVELTPPEAALEHRLRSFDLMVPSPGVPIHHPIYRAAAAAGVRVSAEIELAAELSTRQTGPRILAITGTNGKTTVTTLVAAIFNGSGIRALAAGNIGVPMIDAVQADVEVVVAEVSSFQLQFTHSFRPEVSCWLNLAPDHLDWHTSMEHYGAAKARVWANQQPGDSAVFNADDGAVREYARQIPHGVCRVEFSTKTRAPYRLEGSRLVGPDGQEVIGVDDLPRALPHDVANALAATAVSLSGGATIDGCRKALATTALLPHRVSFVGTGSGVTWYDDSKATTPDSVLAAVAGFSSVVLIAGGRNKGLDLGVLAKASPPVRSVVAIGEAAAEIREAFAGLVPVETAVSMTAAVDAAARLAEQGDAVILSPGCASFDWYRSYAARGDDFAAIVNQRLGKKEGLC